MRGGGVGIATDDLGPVILEAGVGFNVGIEGGKGGSRGELGRGRGHGEAEREGGKVSRVC